VTPGRRGTQHPAGRLLGEVLVLLVRLYQVTLAGLLGGRCRFEPSCSRYAVEAIRAHGPLRGGAMAAWRILRCQPLCRGGFDPVPDSDGRSGRLDGKQNKR
jgi:uncharacterized protein